MAPSRKSARPQSSHADQKSVTDTRCFPPPTRNSRLNWANEANFRKLRNRISQRAFRARQSGYIRELEEKLQRAEKPGLNITKLEEENQRLRGQLLNCHKKLESLIVSMKTVSATLSEATAIEVRNSAYRVWEAKLLLTVSVISRSIMNCPGIEVRVMDQAHRALIHFIPLWLKM